jgi:glycosyltransferase involved in cell wall biosynthesis
MRILIVEGSGRGFLNQYSHALALGLHATGCDVRLVSGARDELAGWEVPFEKLACLTDGLSGWWCLHRQVREFRPDVVHIQWIKQPLAALAFVHWAQARGTAVVYTPHNILPHERRWLSLPIYRKLYSCVDRVVARDRHLGWALEEVLDTPQERLSYLPGSPNPLALPDFPWSEIPELPDHRPGEFRVLFFGHGSARKGLDGFLEVLSQEQWPHELHLVVAGEGVLAGISDDLLAGARARLRISVVNRYLHTAEVTDLFSGGDLLVMPYRKHCKSPLTDLAAAFNVPALMSDRVKGAGFIDGDHGLTYPYDRPDILAGLLRGLASDSEAMADLRYRLAQREPTEAAINHLGDDHRQMYRALLDEKASLTTMVRMADSTANGRI